MQDFWLHNTAAYDPIDVFKETLGLLDSGFGGIDTVEFMSRINDLFFRFEHVTRTREFSHPTSGKSDNAVRHFVLVPLGLSSNLSMHHRLIAFMADGGLYSFDMNKPEALDKVMRTASRQRMVQKLEPALEAYAHYTGNGKAPLPEFMREQNDLSPLFRHDISDYQDFTSTCNLFADMMVNALSDLIKTPETKHFLRAQLHDALGNFIQNRAQDTRDVLARAAQHMPQDVRLLLSENPKAQTVQHYNWLNVSTPRHINPKASVVAHGSQEIARGLRIQMVASAPMLLFQSGVSILDDVAMQSIDWDSGTLNVDRVVGVVFNAKTQPRIDFYKGLKDSDVPDIMLEKMPIYAQYLEDNQPFIPDPQTPKEWRVLKDLARASTQLGQLMERDSTKVFYDLARNNFPYKGEDILNRYFKNAASPSLDDIRLWRNRAVVLPITLKLVSEAALDGIKLPVRHAFYMAAQDDAPFQDIKKAMPRKLITAINAAFGSRKLCNVALDGVNALDIVEAAFDFATHRGDSDRKIQDRILTHRIDEHAKMVVFPELPSIRLPFDYTVTPFANHAELIKACRVGHSSLSYEGVEAIAQNAHFASISRKGGKLLAIAKFREPESEWGAWSVEKIETISTTQSNRTQLDSVMEDYFQHSEFTAKVSLETLAEQRAKTYQKMLSQAQVRDMLMVEPDNIEEKTALLLEYKPYILTKGAWEIDDIGCLSNPHIDTHVRQMINHVKAFYGARP